jgi:hypothetical protein
MTISPVIYKPLDTSYMSIRHTELLKHIRPILQFMTEHHSEILRVVGPSKYQSTNTSADSLALTSNITERLQQLQNISTAPNSIPSNVPSIPSPISNYPKTSTPVPFNSTNLTLHIHSSMEIEGLENSPSDDLLTLSTHIGAHIPNYSSQEWKILEALVNSRMDLWLKQGPSGLWESDSLQNRAPRGNSRRSADDLRFYDSDEDEVGKESRRWDYHNKKQKNEKHESRRGEERRKLVAECKALRQEVSLFENICHVFE